MGLQQTSKCPGVVSCAVRLHGFMLLTAFSMGMYFHVTAPTATGGKGWNPGTDRQEAQERDHLNCKPAGTPGIGSASPRRGASETPSVW